MAVYMNQRSPSALLHPLQQLAPQFHQGIAALVRRRPRTRRETLLSHPHLGGGSAQKHPFAQRDGFGRILDPPPP